jgi:hypothetical protein
VASRWPGFISTLENSAGFTAAIGGPARLPVDVGLVKDGLRHTTGTLWWLLSNPLAWLALFASTWSGASRAKSQRRAEEGRAFKAKTEK